MSTPHNNAAKGEIAEKILLPGDPMRARYIAEHFLEDAVCYNEVRGMLGYTGTYHGERISVQGTGMGMPSMHIYASELMEEYGVKKLIRVGTCGSIHPDLRLKDVVIAMGASTDSGRNHDRLGVISFAPLAAFGLLQKAYQEAQERGIAAAVENIFTSDYFYDDKMQEKRALLSSYGVKAIDMETCELYILAAKYQRESLTLLTVSDCLLTGAKCSAEERQTSFCNMIEIALETLI